MIFGKPYQAPLPPKLENNFPHYISDGSGRDFYVTHNEGGNSHVHRWRDHTDFRFKSSLRNHQRIRMVSHKLRRWTPKRRTCLLCPSPSWLRLPVWRIGLSPMISLGRLRGCPNPSACASRHQSTLTFPAFMIPIGEAGCASTHLCTLNDRIYFILILLLL